MNLPVEKLLAQREVDVAGWEAMTPLEEYLTDRPLLPSHWSRLQAAAGIIPSLARWMDRRIWPKPLRHMRSFAWGFTFRRQGDGTWFLLERGKVRAHSQGLREMVGDLHHRPVTIVASGPSSREVDWERIRKENRFIIAVNGATSVVQSHGLKPELHVVVDRHFTIAGDAHFRNFPDLPLVCTPRVASHVAARTPRIFDSKPFAIIERMNEWYGLPNEKVSRLRELNALSGSPFHFSESNDVKCTVGWSRKPEWAIFSGCTVVISALQIAVGLGAADIEIVGMDLSNAARAYENGEPPVPNHLEQNYASYILPNFEIIHQELSGSSVKIKNLSPVCPLPAGLFDL